MFDQAAQYLDQIAVKPPSHTEASSRVLSAGLTHPSAVGGTDGRRMIPIQSDRKGRSRTDGTQWCATTLPC